MSETKMAISLRDLTFSYGSRVVLHPLDLELQEKKIFALLGPNGSGKTTLFRILSTLMLPQQGTLQILGVDAVRRPSLVRHRMGVLFQHPALDPKLTVRENLLCGGHLFGMRGSSLRQKIQQTAEAVGVEKRLGDLVETLSGGLQRRVEIAKALLPDPDLLILDEPSSGLDPGARSSCWETYRSLCDRGVTVILTTHLMEEADQADRVAIMHQGRMVADGTPADLCSALGPHLVLVRSKEAEKIARAIDPAWLHGEMKVTSSQLRMPASDSKTLVAKIQEQFGDEIQSLTVSPPSLNDVFAHLTGLTLEQAESLAEK